MQETHPRWQNQLWTEPRQALKVTEKGLKQGLEVCKWRLLCKAKNASEQDKEGEGHPFLILALKTIYQPLKIRWISVVKRPSKGQHKGLRAWLKTRQNEACKGVDDPQQQNDLKQTSKGPQNKTFFSWQQSSNMHANNAKRWIKIKLKWGKSVLPLKRSNIATFGPKTQLLNLWKWPPRSSKKWWKG